MYEYLDTSVGYTGNSCLLLLGERGWDEKQAQANVGRKVTVGVISALPFSEWFCCGAAPRTPCRSFYSHVRCWGGGRPVWYEVGATFRAFL